MQVTCQVILFRVTLQEKFAKNAENLLEIKQRFYSITHVRKVERGRAISALSENIQT